jgi:uncharacterized protein
VHDNAGVFSKKEVMELEGLLSNFEKETSCEIYLCTVTNTEGMGSYSYSIDLMNRLKPGKRYLNNGALILLSINESSLEIRTSYGIESIMSKILYDSLIGLMVPKFKLGKFFDGSKLGVTLLMDLMDNIKWTYCLDETSKRCVRKISINNLILYEGEILVIENDQNKVFRLILPKSMKISTDELKKGLELFYLDDTNSQEGKLIGINRN